MSGSSPFEVQRALLPDHAEVRSESAAALRRHPRDDDQPGADPDPQPREDPARHAVLDIPY